MRNLSAILATCILLCTISSAWTQTLMSEQTENEVFTVVEEMPIPWLYKTSCLDAPYGQKYECYMTSLSAYLSENVKYPYPALKNKVEGTVVVEFVIDEKGKVSVASVLKDIGSGCGEAALTTVRDMPDWIPGRQGGVPVKVKFTLPVKFEIKE